jgi:hypothetical protein
MEELVLTDPVVIPEKVTDKYKVVSLTMNGDPTNLSPGGEQGMVSIMLRDNLGGMFSHQYTGTTAMDYIKFINTGNFTTKSLNKRILERLSNEGVLPGTVTGTPDPPAGDYE